MGYTHGLKNFPESWMKSSLQQQAMTLSTNNESEHKAAETGESDAQKERH